jgi:hypothetical protein
MVVAFTGQNLLVKPMMMATRVHEKGVLAKALTPKSLCDGLRQFNAPTHCYFLQPVLSKAKAY